MIGGQYLDITGGGDRPRGAAPAEDRLPLLAPRSRCALWAAEVPRARADAVARVRATSSACSSRSSTTSSTSDGYVLEHGADGARALADEAAERAQARLAEIPARHLGARGDRRRASPSRTS